MLKTGIVALFLASVAAAGAYAQTSSAPPADISRMDLSPTKDVVRPVYSRQDFTDSAELPKKVDYKLPAPGMDASVGLNGAGERDLENEEINQAAAIGFSRPDDSVGASIDYRF